MNIKPLMRGVPVMNEPVAVALWSMKGGVGVTVTAAVLAMGLAENGHDVLAVDLGADLGPTLGVPVEPGPGISDWLASPSDVDAEALHRIGREVAPRLTLLSMGSAHLASESSMDADRQLALDAALRSSGKSLVVDVGSLAGPLSPHHRLRIHVAQAMTTQWLVTRRCYLAVSASTRTPVPPDGILVVSERHRALSAADAAEAIGAPLVAECSLDMGLARVVDSGLLLARAPRSLCRFLGNLFPQAQGPRRARLAR